MKNKTEHIYKGESDGEDLSQLSDDTIWEKLKNRIYDSTLTIVMLSKGMREKYKAEKHQWIPQEISYSLKEISRIDSSGNSVTSKTNALIAVIIPDIYMVIMIILHIKKIVVTKSVFIIITTQIGFLQL